MNEWNFIPGHIFNQIKLRDCNDTVTGYCLENMDIENCVKHCKDDPDCKYGYFLKNSNKNSNNNSNKSYCVPLKQEFGCIQDIYFHIRDKNIYPELNSYESTVFVHKNIDISPNSNYLRFKDTLYIRNKNHDSYLGISDEKSVSEFSDFSLEPILEVQFLPVSNEKSRIKNSIICEGDMVIINIPQSSLALMKDSQDDFINWYMYAVSMHEDEDTFTIHSANPDKKLGEPLNYDESFYFYYYENLLVYDPEYNRLKLVRGSYDDNMSSHENASLATFTLEPTVNVYYTHGDQCRSVQLRDTETKNEHAYFNGKPVRRSQDCFMSISKSGVPKEDNTYIYYIGIGIFLIILGIIYYRRK